MRVALGVRDRGGRDGSGTAVLVVLGAEPERHELDLVAGAPDRRPYHGVDVEARVERVAAVAASEALAGLTAVVEPLRTAGHEVVGIALPVEEPGPSVLDRPLAEIVAAHTLIHAAEAELYRDALATAATDLGLAVTRYPARDLRAVAAKTIDDDLAAFAAEIGRRLGRPWRREHADAAIAARLLLDSGS